MPVHCAGVEGCLLARLERESRMRPRVAASAVLCLLGWLGMACQSRTPTPTSTPLPTATLSPSRTWTPTSEPLPTITTMPSHTQTQTSEPLPTITPTPIHTLEPTPTLGPLTDEEAIAQMEDELAARGVDLQTVRITIAGEPRSVSIHYSSTFDVKGRAFQAQTVLVALAAARVFIRVQPPMDGGIRLAVIPSGESEVGIRVTMIEGSSLEAWAKGSISDQDFVGSWMVWTVTRE
jgi:hypothetical protein